VKIKAGLTLDAKFKQGFFNPGLITDRLDKINRRAMIRAGSFIRKRARSSIRRRKKPSEPGKPPNTHSRNRKASLRNIWFAYDQHRETLVVGPGKISEGQPDFVNWRGTVPEVLEYGGTGVTVPYPGPNRQYKRKLKRRGKRSPVVRARMEARPYMRPALEQEIEAGNVMKGWRTN